MFRKFCYRYLLILCCALLLAACHERQAINGNGAKETVTRNVADFQNIHLNGNFDVVLVAQMPQQVSLTADSNVLRYITTNVNDHTLFIDTDPDVNLTTKEVPLLEIFVPTIEGITVTGATDISATKINSDKLAINISGSGRFNISGQTNNVTIAISGSGEVNGQDLAVKDAKIDVSGSGQVSVHATQEINVKVSGTGLVEYYGSPSKVNQAISGSGKVIGISTNAKKNPT